MLYEETAFEDYVQTLWRKARRAWEDYKNDVTAWNGNHPTIMSRKKDFVLRSGRCLTSRF